MNSAAKAFGEDVRNLAAIDSEPRVSYHVFERAIFRYGLAVLSVALALGIKLAPPSFKFSLSAQHFFPGRDRDHFLVCGNRTRHSCSRAFIAGVRLFRTPESN